MYIISDIITAMESLVGWRDSSDPTVERIPVFLTSSSGFYVNDGHPLVTIENIIANSKIILTSTYPAYDVNKTYSKGDYVKNESKLYRSLLNNNKGNITSENSWQETTPLGEELRDILNNSITDVISDVISAKQMNAAARTLVDSKYLFHAAGRLKDTIENAGRLVGFEITIPRIPEIKLEINKIGLQFTESQKNLKIYVFHSSQEDPIHTFTLTTTNGRSFEWATLTEKILKYVNTYDTGTFYIVYYQPDISGQAIRKLKDWSKPPCTSCGRADLEAYNSYSRFIKIHPFRVSSANLEAGYNEYTGDFDAERKLWDIELNDYTYDTNYGLNLLLSIKCDLTDFLVQHKTMFSNLIRQRATIKVLERLAYNQDHALNRSQETISPEMVQYILTGEHGNSGLIGQYNKMIKNMEINLSGFDPLCIPCKKKNVRYSSVG